MPGARWGARRRTWPLAPLAFVAACHLPVSLVVDASTVRELERTVFVEGLDEGRVRTAVRTWLPFTGEPLATDPERYWRCDRSVGPFAPTDLVAGAAALDGLASGDLILAKNDKPQALGTTLTLSRFTLYTHIGLLEIDAQGTPFVHESWPTIRLLSLAPSLAARFSGKVARVPLAAYVARYDTLSFVRLAGLDAQAVRGVLEEARLARAEGVAFDPHHDPDDPRLSCSEYLERLLTRGAGLELVLDPIPVCARASVQALVGGLGFRTLGYVVPDAFARQPGAREVGVLSRLPSEGAVRASNEAYRVLHAHFMAADDGVGVGSYVRYDRVRLVRFRENVAAFLAWSAAYGDSAQELDGERLEADLKRLLPAFFQRLD